MNRKQSLILLVLVAVVGGIGLALYKSDSKSYQGGTRAGQKLLGEFDVNEVAALTIKHENQQVNLARENDQWVVKERGGYPANFEQIADFIRKVYDLKVVQPMKATPTLLPKLQLAESGKGTNAATVVQLKNGNDKPIKTLLLGATVMKKSERESPFGDEGGFPSGRYVMPEGASTVAVISDPLTTAEPKPEQWLNKDFLKVEKVSAITLVSTNATNSWKLSRPTENGIWVLAEPKEGEVLDTNKVSGIANALNYPSFSDVAVGKKPEDMGLDKPTTVTLETFDKFKYTVKVGGNANDDSVYVAFNVEAELPKERAVAKDEKPEEKEKLDKEFKEGADKLAEKLKQEKAYEKWVYVMPKWTIESLLKNRSELMVEKKEEPSTADRENENSEAKASDAEPATALP